MKERTKGFVSGIMVSAVMLGCMASAMAAYQKQATLDYTGIQITLDGKEVKPTDANGKAVEPFAIDGTTYLPVRGVAGAMGLGVEWDQAAQTVKLSSPTPAPAPTPAPSPAPSTAGQVILDQGGIKVTYNGVSYDGTLGPELKLTIENTTKKSVVVQVRGFSVNGYMISPTFSCEVAAGKKAKDEITILKEYMDQNELTAVDRAEFYFSVTNTDDWTDSFQSPVITIENK